MNRKETAALAVLIVVFAVAAAVALPFDPVREGTETETERDETPASLPDTEEGDDSGDMVLGIGLVSVVAALIVAGFWTLRTE